jgi:polar amino acid transport system substrate-binding protein
MRAEGKNPNPLNVIWAVQSQTKKFALSLPTRMTQSGLEHGLELPVLRSALRVARRLPLLRSSLMPRILLSAIALINICTFGAAMGQSAPVTEIATNGKLRTGSISIRVLGGVAEPVGQFVATKLGVPYEPVMYPNPEAYVQSFGKGEWDIAIGPRVLAAADKADSGADVWLIDLIYVAAPGRPFADVAEVDRPGIKVGVIQGSPSDRFLSHNLKAAEIVRIPLSATISDDAAELLRSGRSDVFGADSGVIYPTADLLAGSTLVPGTFNVVRVAVALPKGRSSETQARIAGIVSEAKRTGVVQKAIEAEGLKGVHVAPN